MMCNYKKNLEQKKEHKLMKNNCNGSEINYKKLFVDKFKELSKSRNAWQVWSDVITMMACALANATTDKSSQIFETREKEYEECVQRLEGDCSKAAELFAIFIMALYENQEQDFLGTVFMELGFGSRSKGQVFTPYDIAELTTKLTVNGNDNIIQKIKAKGFISVLDCCCGSGCQLIANANTYKEQHIDYSKSVLFVAQDIDRVVALMCYIQLSLLGCAGYVIVGDTLSTPVGGSVLNPIKQGEQEIWLTPQFNLGIWKYRRVIDTVMALLPKDEQ